jgi:hypothetical protein
MEDAGYAGTDGQQDIEVNEGRVKDERIKKGEMEGGRGT